MKKISFFVLFLFIFHSIQTARAQTETKKRIVPGEQAPPPESPRQGAFYALVVARVDSMLARYTPGEKVPDDLLDIGEHRLTDLLLF